MPGGLRLILVDNDPAALELVVFDLGLEGHTIVGTGSSGDEAIALCTAHQIDVLVTDFRMPPGMDGVEVARRLQARPSPARVVVYTNHLSAAVSDGAEKAGAVALRKGNLDALRQVLDRLVSELRLPSPGTVMPQSGRPPPGQIPQPPRPPH